MSLLEELKRTESLQGEELDNALLDIRNTYTSEEERKVMKEYLEASYASIREELAEVREEIMELSLRKQLGDVYDVLPLSYIAEKYFKRTRSWLYQRLNGYKVNGKVCSFTEEEKATFRMAARDVAQMISSAQFV